MAWKTPRDPYPISFASQSLAAHWASHALASWLFLGHTTHLSFNCHFLGLQGSSLRGWHDPSFSISWERQVDPVHLKYHLYLPLLLSPLTLLFIFYSIYIHLTHHKVHGLLPVFSHQNATFIIAEALCCLWLLFQCLDQWF